MNAIETARAAVTSPGDMTATKSSASSIDGKENTRSKALPTSESTHPRRHAARMPRLVPRLVATTTTTNGPRRAVREP